MNLVIAFISVFFAHSTVPAKLSSSSFPQRAFCVVPVADLMGSRQKTEGAYRSIPVCGGKNASLSCKRIHQLLFNEQVLIHQEKGDEYYIEIFSSYYLTRDNPTRAQTKYWICKKALLPFDYLHKKALSTEYIPAPITFAPLLTSPSHAQSIVTLAMPYHDPSLAVTFSAGTRFVKAGESTADGFPVFAFDKKNGSFKKIILPHSLCIVDSPTIPPATRIKNFLRILTAWSHLTGGFIPYVWGGSSFTKPYTKPFCEKTSYRTIIPSSYYSFGAEDSSPQTGFDCSNLIARAALMAGIPYFFKNTFTIGQRMKPLTVTQALAPGDLILIPGHVMVISDISRNLLIEARSYPHGYGKVQELPLNAVFKDIETYQDLINAYREHKTIYRIDCNGEIRDTIPQVKLYKLDQVWDS